MSHISLITEAKIADPKILIESLVELGIPRELIEYHRQPQQIYDYKGKPTNYRWRVERDQRFKTGDKCHVIVRKHYIGAVHNDMGWYVDPKTGAVTFICDFAMRGAKTCFPSVNAMGGLTKRFLKELRQTYHKNVAIKHYKGRAKKITHGRTPDGKIKVFIHV